MQRCENEYIKYVITLLWFSSTFIVSVLIFTNGLLLHREELPHSSVCTITYNTTKNLPLHYHPLADVQHQHCLSTNFKVILIVIDALRYDFIEYQNIHEEELPYQNKFTFVHHLLKTKPQHSKLLKFIADPPTTTMQRIKGFTTGSLSTFIDISSNFDSPEINEDNLIDILGRTNKTAVFMGDDTWLKLYPKRFLRSYPYDSFNVWDLDTVDEGVKYNLFPELNNSDWDLLIGHFLGVDHCGHKFGPNHVEMKRKLKEMNEVLEKIVNEIQYRDDIILFVIGDHGMTSTGDHGGETQNEVTSAMFVYSPVHELYEVPFPSEIVNQVDIVPTLSSILGLAIPFSNLGSVLLECIPVKILNSIAVTSFLLHRNAHQMTNYIREYFRFNSQFTALQLEFILSEYRSLVGPSNDLSTLIRNYRNYMKNVLKICQKVWITFDVISIFLGLIGLCLGSVCCFLFTEFKFVQSYILSFSSVFLYVFLVTIFTIILVTKVYSFDLVMSSMVCFETASISLMIYLCIKLKKLIHFKQCFQRYEFVDFCFLLLYTVFVVLPFSNSFILEEPRILLFLFTTSLWLVTLRISTFKLILHAFIINVVYRLVLKFTKCRQEEDYECRNVQAESVSYFSCVLAIAFFIVFVYFAYKHESNMIVLLTISILLILYWMEEATYLPNAGDFKVLSNIPAFLLVILFSLFCSFYFKPNLLNPNEKSNILRSCFINLVIIICILCTVVLGQLYVIPAVLMNITAWYLAGYTCSAELNTSWKSIVLWGMSSVYWFYATGHNTSFSSIQWNAAFLVQNEMNSMFVPGMLVTFHTFLAYFVHSILLGLIPIVPYLINCKFKITKQKLYEDTFDFVLKYFLFFSIRMLFTMSAVYFHSRHLMMWGVFAPEFIFQSLSFIIMLMFSILGYIFMIRVVKCMDRIETTSC